MKESEFTSAGASWRSMIDCMALLAPGWRTNFSKASTEYDRDESVPVSFLSR